MSTVEVEGTVEHIRFVSEQSHWTVASVRCVGGGPPVSAVGHLPGLAVGMRVRLAGTWVDSPRYGRQLQTERYEELVPGTARGIASYLASGFIHGIGEKMAQRIVERFGEQTFEVIKSTPGRLTEVPGLGRKRVEAITAALQERHGAREALVFLYGLGISPGFANRVFQRYGPATVRLVQANPYRLAEDVRGIGFHKADKVAREMAIDRDHPDRVRAGCYHVLSEATGEGHCFLPRDVLVQRATQLLGLTGEAVDPGVAALALDGKVVLDVGAGASGAPDAGDQRVYLHYLHEAERAAARHLAELLRGRPEPHDLARRLSRAEERLGLDLAPGQRAAVRLALGRGTVIITGGPGTGKTTIIKALLVAAGVEPHRVALAAPTGRAAKRLAEATGREARTIHRLLEFSPADARFQRDEEDPLDADLVVIDEASMVDLPLMEALVRAIPSHASLVLVGDVDQLPPVGPGSPLTDLIACRRVPVARLTTIFRQGAGSAIIDSAHLINRGEVPRVTKAGTPLQDFYFIEREAPEDIRATIEDLVARRIPRRFGLDPIGDVQVLSPMRAGLIGVDQLNVGLQALLNPAGPELVVGQTTYRLGDKVMQIRNDYERGVFNGDLGRISRVDGKGQKLSVVVDDREVLYDRASFDDLVLAYAASVHKSQGSEYPAVVLPVSTQHYKMLQRNLVYTGVTRGKRLVVLVGTRRAMGIAVGNRDLAQRNSSLAARIIEHLDGLEAAASRGQAS